MSASAVPDRRPDLIFRQIDDDVCVYDPVRDRILLLNATSALILDLCDGTRTWEQIEAEAAAQTIAFLEQYIGKNKSPMCGNSVCQDRRFLAKTMPTLEAFFHYRNLDVSTLKELAKRWKPAALEGFKKAQAHTALADIHESIDELAHYRTTLLNLG